MTTAGLAAAATIRVGYYLGSHDFKNLKLAAYTLLVMAIAFMCVWGIVFIFGRHLLPPLYVDDPGIFPIAASLLIIAGLFQLSDGIQVVCVAALRGMQDVKVPSIYIFVAYWLIGLPLGYYLAFVLGIGANGIWWGLFIGLTLTALAMFLRLRQLIHRLQFKPATAA
jgi:MATE family multidrug resistance protein